MNRKCDGCGLRLRDSATISHKYLTCSPACWEVFNKSMILHFSEAPYWRSHQLLADAYLLQHSNSQDRRARSSTRVHLAGLATQIVYQLPDQKVIAIRKGMVSVTRDFPAIEAPATYSMTISDVSVEDSEAHHETVIAFANAIWSDWEKHHDWILGYIDKKLAQFR